MSVALSSSGGGFLPAPGITPASVQQEIVNCVLGGAPFAASLTRRMISANSTVFPVVEPTGTTWVAEGQPLPTVTLGDKSYTVIPRKLSGIYSMSSELIDDSTFSIMQALGDAVRDSAGPELDDGLLNGTGVAPLPVGVIGVAAAVDGTSLWAAASAAAAAIGEEGGTADTIALSPTDAAAEASKIGTDGHPVFPAGMTTMLGLRVVQVPALPQTLVYDSTRVLFIVRADLSLEASADAGFANDTTLCRIKGRFAVAVPCTDKAIRKLTVAGAPAMMRTTKASSKS